MRIKQCLFSHPRLHRWQHIRDLSKNPLRFPHNPPKIIRLHAPVGHVDGAETACRVHPGYFRGRRRNEAVTPVFEFVIPRKVVFLIWLKLPHPVSLIEPHHFHCSSIIPHYSLSNRQIPAPRPPGRKRVNPSPYYYLTRSHLGNRGRRLIILIIPWQIIQKVPHCPYPVFTQHLRRLRPHPR